jgi:aldose sugar dehydrogenase
MVSLTLIYVITSVMITNSLLPVFSLEASEQPTIRDSKMSVETVYEGLDFPTSMTFLGPGDILVLEKNEGTVKRIVNGEMLPEPLLKVDVSSVSERGMLGIAIEKVHNSSETQPYVFLYYTEPEPNEKDRGGDSNSKIPTARNSVYRYELIDNKLVNPQRLLQLPGRNEAGHNGGTLLVGPDNNIYTSAGSVALDKPESDDDITWSQNVIDGPEADGRGGILRFTQDGKEIEDEHTLSDEYPMTLYYAYGIRNSFGMDFDPLTGILWDTENGANGDDEINLVEPGFNSGWRQTMGLGEEEKRLDPDQLVDFDGRGKYSDPKFTWETSVGATALKFLSSDRYGKEYQNGMFVSDFHNGNIYYFNLNEERTDLELRGTLSDRIANNGDNLQEVVFGQGFGGITDLDVGPDGYLYVLSLHQGGDNCSPSEAANDRNCISYDSAVQGVIFRINAQQ